MTRFRYSRGTSMVEMLIVMVVLLMLLFAVFDFGRALYTYSLTANAARLGARFASVRGSTCVHTSSSPDPYPCPAYVTPRGTSASSAQLTAAQQQVQTYVQSVSPLLDPTTLTVATTWPAASPTCSSSGPVNAPGCEVVAQVSDTFNFLFPWMPAASINFRSDSQMVISQ